MDQLLPEWAQPFGDADSANDYWDLVCEVASLRWGGEISLSYLAGKVKHSDGRVAQVHNIARAAVGLPTDLQRRGLYSFFSMMDDMKRSVELLRDWEWVAPRLRRRLQFHWEPGWELLTKRVDRHTQWVVAVDSDSSCAPVNTEWLADWGVSEEEVWARATRQSLQPRGMRRLRIDEVEGTNGGPSPMRFNNRLFCFDGDMYTSGLAADLTGRFQRPLGEHGALISAPTAHQLFVHPIEDFAHVPQLIAPLTVLSIMRTETEPNPISNSVLWYRRPGLLEPCTEFTPPMRIDVTCTSEPLRTVLIEGDQAA